MTSAASLGQEPANRPSRKPAPGRPPRRMAPERRRAQLIATALELYSRVPPDQVSVEDVVRAADISRALFYRYFPNISELHVAALGAVTEELVNRLTIAPGGSLLDDLHAALDTFLAVVEQHSDAYVALLRSGSTIATGETDALVESVRAHIVEMVVSRAGGGTPSPLFRLTVRGWVALVESASLGWLPQRTVPRDRLRGWLADQLLAMLAVSANHEDRRHAGRST